MLLTTTLKLLQTTSHNIPQNTFQAATHTPQASMGPLPPPLKGIMWRTIHCRTSCILILSMSRYYLDPFPHFFNNKKKENKNIPPPSSTTKPPTTAAPPVSAGYCSMDTGGNSTGGLDKDIEIKKDMGGRHLSLATLTQNKDSELTCPQCTFTHDHSFIRCAMCAYTRVFSTYNTPSSQLTT